MHASVNNTPTATRWRPAGIPLATLCTRAALAATTCLILASCGDFSYANRNSPANAYKDYELKNRNNSAVLGMGEPISNRQMSANATISLTGEYDVEQVMQRLSGTYNVAVRWGNGVRKGKRQQVVINKLTFDEARNYLEDVYGIQIIKEGERRLLVLPSASEPRLASFNPGVNVTLSQAIRGLAEQCKYNLVVTENKAQLNQIRVTTNLQDVTCYDAFAAILNPNGMSLISEGDYYTIGSLPQRQWTVNIYEPVRQEETSVNYSSDFSSGDSKGGGGSQSAGGSSKITVKYERNLWADLEGDLKELIKNNCPAQTDKMKSSPSAMGGSPNAPQLLPPPSGKGEGDKQLLGAPAKNQPNTSKSLEDNESSAGGDEQIRCGYVRINQSVGLIQMRAPQAVLEEANEIIQRVQEVASRRLLLEARVLAVKRERNYNQGGTLKLGQSKEGVTASQGFTGSVTSAISGLLGTYSTDVGGVSSNVGALGVTTKNLDALVGVLEKYGTTYQLMHPMMELMDRQRSTLIDGTNQKYFIIKSTTTTGTATSTAADVEERSQFLGLQFSAAAQVSDNPSEPHTIALQIPITSKVGEINVPSGTSGTTAGVAPIANTRLIDQKVRIRDGEIKAIGGLTITLATDKESGVPVLRDIPAFGKMINNDSVEYSEVEFVVLLQVKRLN